MPYNMKFVGPHISGVGGDSFTLWGRKHMDLTTSMHNTNTHNTNLQPQTHVPLLAYTHVQSLLIARRICEHAHSPAVDSHSPCAVDGSGAA